MPAGELAEDAMERVLATLDEYAGAADEHGANRAGWPWPPARCATPPTASALPAEVRERSRLRRPHDHGRRGGAAHVPRRDGRQGRPDEPALVVDIGGGSTEYVVGSPGEPPTFHVSTRLGSVRQTRAASLERPARAAGARGARGGRARHRRGGHPAGRPRERARGNRRGRHRHLAGRRSTRRSSPTTPRRCTATA